MLIVYIHIHEMSGLHLFREVEQIPRSLAAVFRGSEKSPFRLAAFNTTLRGACTSPSTIFGRGIISAIGNMLGCMFFRVYAATQ